MFRAKINENMYMPVHLSFTIITRAATSENRSAGLPTSSDTNQPVQSLKMDRNLKFQFKKKRNRTILVAETKALITSFYLEYLKGL